jgi:tetratricopeptide (TPR) repeat protein
VLVFIVKRRQGRMSEIVDLVGTAAASVESLVGVRIMEGVALAELGRLDEARDILEEVAARDFEDIPLTQISSSILWGCAVVAAMTGSQMRAEQLVQLLSPFGSFCIYNGLCGFGAIASVLGSLSTTLGRYDDADEWFSKAAQIEERMDAPAHLTQTRCEWAAALLARRADGDETRARTLLAQVSTTAAELGMEAVGAQARALGA